MKTGTLSAIVLLRPGNRGEFCQQKDDTKEEREEREWEAAHD